MAKKKTAAATKPAAKKTTAIAPAPASKPMTLDVKLTHSEFWPAAVAYRDRAATLVISDKRTHEGALKEVTEGGALDRKIRAFWKPIKQSIDKVKKAVLDLERAEVEAVEAGRDPLEKRCVAWKKAEDDRVAAAAKAIQDAAEATARATREAELKAQEDAALELEASSPNLSVRELWFVEKVFEQGIDLDDTSMVNLTAMSLITKQAGYADPRKWAERLAASPKVRDAIAVKVQARAVREQAAALREEPIYVPAAEVESNLATVSGAHYTKNYTLGAVEDVAKLRAAYKAGELPDEAFIPNEVHLRRMAKDLKEKFPQAYPGCTLKIDEGVAG